MKKIAVFVALLCIVSLTSCRKEKVCRCAVINSQSTPHVNGQTIRLITIDKGSCEDIRFVYYDRDHGLIEKDQNITDSVLCTDHRFPNDPDDLLAQ